MKRAYDILIAGGGIVGAACADELARRGADVCVVEAECAGSGATAAGMGHVVVMDDSEAQFALNHCSQQLWNELREALPENCEFDGCGTLWAAADEEEMNEARRKADHYAARGVAAEILDSAALAEAEPNLRPGLAGALFVPGDSVVFAPCVAKWLLDRAMENGATLITGKRIVELRSDGAVLNDGSIISAKRMVNAAGSLAPQLTPGIPVRPRKGHIVVTDRYPGFVRHHITELGYLKNAHASDRDSVSFVVQRRMTGQVLLGSSRQFDVTDAAIEPGILARMIQRALEYMPGLGQLNTIRCWAGFRAATPDNLPLIGPHPTRENLWLATGHEGLGITMAPGTGRLLADLMLDGEALIDPAPYLPARFANSEARHG
ncbi:FAD-dependent oxidoreductase [Candidatus Sumerlaeota bacterium]|nr:FAD-dependent oxidoreductase [Candidatus Sumerlaeota bacterium]